MLEWLWHFFSGWVEIAVDSTCRSTLADLLWRLEIPFWHEKRKADTLRVRIPFHCYPVFSAQAEENCFCFTVNGQGGWPVVLRFCRCRPGILLGFCLLFFWCLYSQNLIWDIEIDGCVTLDPSEVEKILTEAGCGVGDFVPVIDFDLLHARIKADNPDIAWMSVYMNGTTAEVQLRETKHPENRSHPPGTYANVVAAEAGEIVSVKVFEGEAVVKTGDVVMPGELLISGVVSMKNEGQSRTEYAAGEVLAEVAVPVSLEVSCVKEKKVYTGREKTKKSIKIFKKSINLFVNTGIPYATYDTIDKMEEVCLFGRFQIPVTIYSTVCREYEMVEEKRSSKEAVEEAVKKLREETEKAIGSGEMLRRTVTTSVSEDGSCRIDSLLYVLRDIASTEEFTVHDSPENTP